jgi:heme-degrading monooxygenase HmoA
MLTVGRAMGLQPSNTNIVQLHDKFMREVSKVDGFISSSIWASLAEPTEFAMLNHYRAKEAAENALQLASEGDFLNLATRAFSSPLDIKQNIVTYERGTDPGDMARGSFMSLSDRSADPGHGPDLEAELKRIFTELEAIEGFRGAVVCHNCMLEEEVMGIVLWDKVEAFLQSLPSKILYEVKLYTRVQ